MVTWIIIVVGYVIGMGLFHVLGGLSSAGRALESWGAAVASVRSASASSSG